VIESEIWVKLRLECAIQNIAPTRIENAIGSGMFDTELSWDNQTIWIELKSGPNEKLRVPQRAWARQRWRKGCSKDMFVLYETSGFYKILPVTFILDVPDGCVGSRHAMAFPTMGKLVAYLKGHWSDPWTQ
jgi:hypothetical protein